MIKDCTFSEQRNKVSQNQAWYLGLWPSRVGVPFLVCTNAPCGLQLGPYLHLGGMKQQAQFFDWVVYFSGIELQELLVYF